ncbi:MAG: polyprenyl synthetase family protein [bacterium]
MAIEDIEEFVRREAERISGLLGDALGSGGKLPMHDAMRYALEGGGKRIRPILVGLACEAVSGDFRRALPAALAVEMLHNFTLVHDDIMDNSPKRRGEPTVYKKWDLNTALLAGDALFARAYIVLLETDVAPDVLVRAAETFARGALDVCEGQALDGEFSKREVSIDEYLRMVRLKTSSLISMALRIGGIIGRGREEEVDSLGDFGANLGVAFQVNDDLLDIVGGAEFGKIGCNDVREGKRTLPIIYTLSQPLWGDRLRKYLGRKRLRGEDLEELIEIFDASGALDFARERAALFTAEAHRCLDRLPQNGAVKRLRLIADSMLSRKR